MDKKNNKFEQLREKALLINSEYLAKKQELIHIYAELEYEKEKANKNLEYKLTIPDILKKFIRGEEKILTIPKKVSIYIEQYKKAGLSYTNLIYDAIMTDTGLYEVESWIEEDEENLEKIITAFLMGYEVE